jgi:CheY-like chemotaxis protein
LFSQTITGILLASANVSDSKKQPQILVVDDDRDYLLDINDMFIALSAGRWQIHMARSADAALNILKQHKMDLALVDINMPLVDGVQFLRLLNRRYPEIKKVSLTAYADEGKRTECLANGAELFIEKPRSLDGYKSVFAMLDDLVTWAPKTGFQGMLRQVGLDDVIQMECLCRNSSILEISNQRMRGRIFIEEGKIIHATMGAESGERVLHKLLAFVGGEFKLLPFEPPAAYTIEGPWEFLLMEAARVRDELTLAEEPVSVEDPSPPDFPNLPSVLVTETLICTAQGEPIYSWQCPDDTERIALLQNLAQQTALLSRSLPLGKLERLEILQPEQRALAVFGPDRIIFIRTVTPTAAR